MANYNTKESVVDYLKSQGQDSSYSARAKLAKSAGITNYTGSETQNIQLLNTLKSGSSSNNGAKTNNDVKTDNDVKASNNADVTPKSTIKGVDDALYDRMNTPFEASNNVSEADERAGKGLSNLESLTSKDQIISDDVMSALGSSFVIPSAVREADAYLAQQLEKIQSGKTSYSDDVRAMMDKIMNRDKFSYDVDTDPLFQQALASAMSSGKQAMQDTIGQASALTGGYGSSYATTAGNQAYNSFIEDAYDNLPQYYQMALEAYQMEGDEMYRQYGMLSAEDDKEYNRNVTAYDATYQHRNRVYDEAYNMYRDSKNDAFAMANLQLNEHGQRVSDAYNYYNAVSNEADKVYEREYNSWMDTVNIAWKEGSMLNSDYWNQSNQDFQATESQKQREWQSAEAEKERAFTASENAKNRSVKSSSGGSGYKLSTTEISAITKAYNDAGGGEKGIEAAMNQLEALGKAPQSAEEADVVYGLLGQTTGTSDSKSGVDWTTATITKTEDTTNGFLGIKNIWGGIDNNDVYTVNGKTYYADDIKAAMEEDNIPQATIDKIIKDINKLGKNGTYTYKK